MSVHVAILLKPYVQMILAGRKTIKSRLTRTPRAPYHAIKPGHRIFFKASIGPYRGPAVADEIEFHGDLTPGKVNDLRRRLNDSVCGDAQFWQWKRDSRYATFIILRDVEPTDFGPKMPPSSGIAWFMLDDKKGPAVFDIALTIGAIRNSYLRVPRHIHQFALEYYGGKPKSDAGLPVTLILPDDRMQKTDIVGNNMIRWRGWGRYYREHRLRARDVIRFVQLGPRRYRISFVSNNGTLMWRHRNES